MTPALFSVGADQVIVPPVAVGVGESKTGEDGTVNGLLESDVAPPMALTLRASPEVSLSQLDPEFRASSSFELATAVSVDVGTVKLAPLYSAVPFTK